MSNFWVALGLSLFLQTMIIMVLSCFGYWLLILKPEKFFKRTKKDDAAPLDVRISSKTESAEASILKAIDDISVIFNRRPEETFRRELTRLMEGKRKKPAFDVKVSLEKRTGSNIWIEYIPVSRGYFDAYGDLWIVADYWPEVAPWRDETVIEFRSKLRSYMLANGRGVPQIDALLDCAESAAREVLHPQTYVERYHGNR